MSSVNSINSALSSALSSTTGSSSSSQFVSENTFLQLLVTQLKNQDPLNPEDSSQFVAQLAEFSSVEQLTQLNSSLETVLENSATSLIGQTVTVYDSSSSTGYVQGTVTGIVYYSNGPAVQVDGKNYSLSDVQNVGSVQSTGS